MDLITAITVDSAGDGRYHLAWDARFASGPVAIRVATRAAEAAAAPVMLQATGEGVDLPALAPATRHYFRLEPPGGAALVVAQRNVPFAGCVNFRDLGGYRTADGRRVRWGTLFRSGHMANLTPADQAFFATLDIRTICDFRLVEERAREVGSLPGGPRCEVLGIPPGVGDREYLHRIFAARPAPAVVLAAIHDIMRSFVMDAQAQYRRLFEVLLEAEEGAALLNCSAGKERTGIGAALLLTALGVPRETVFYDFMLSRRYFPAESEIPRVREKYGVTEDGAAGRALIMPLLETRESYLQSAFAVIDREYGSGEAYLRTCCALGSAELERLRARYTRGE